MQLFGRYSLCIHYETYALECRDPESFIVCSYLVDTVCVSIMRRMLLSVVIQRVLSCAVIWSIQFVYPL